MRCAVGEGLERAILISWTVFERFAVRTVEYVDDNSTIPRRNLNNFMAAEVQYERSYCISSGRVPPSFQLGSVPGLENS